MTVLRVLRTAKATLSRTFYLDEVAASATGAVTVAVARMDGTAVESGNAAGPDANGAYAYTFSGSDVLDHFTVTWAATVGGDAIVLDQDVIEVVGGFFFGLAEGRDEDPALRSTTKYPTSLLIRRRIEAEDECERITGQAWVPRFARATLSGDASGHLRLPHTMIRKVRAVTANGVAFSVDQVAGLGFSDTGMVYVGTGVFAPYRLAGSRNVTIEYEHGHDRPDPDLLRGALIRFKSLVLSGLAALPDRAERLVTVDAGTVFLASPDVDKTGIPEVDAIYRRHPSPRPGFG